MAFYFHILALVLRDFGYRHLTVSAIHMIKFLPEFQQPIGLLKVSTPVSGTHVVVVFGRLMSQELWKLSLLMVIRVIYQLPLGGVT